MYLTPWKKIRKTLSKNIPAEYIDILPDKWEKIGDVLIIKLPVELKKYQENVAKEYANILRCKSVLNNTAGIEGIYREPKVEHIYGPKNTETIHKENGIKYKLDPQKIMFSSGNMDERMRMATISNKDEIVVDLFAGIGYFTLPIAVHSKPKKIFACEINPTAYNYLCENIVLNNVSSIVEPLEGDNKKVAPENVADRIIMGFFGGIKRFLPIAIKCLIDEKGIIHYHDKFLDKSVPDKPLKILEAVVEKNHRRLELIDYKNVKSYAPGISHFVFDIRIGEK
jgi:tRNA wybutosine-synthesizing protein 2